MMCTDAENRKQKCSLIGLHFLRLKNQNLKYLYLNRDKKKLIILVLLGYSKPCDGKDSVTIVDDIMLKVYHMVLCQAHYLTFNTLQYDKLHQQWKCTFYTKDCEIYISFSKSNRISHIFGGCLKIKYVKKTRILCSMI